MELKPSVKQMLKVGKDCGLYSLEEACSNYLKSLYSFFSIHDYFNQFNDFVIELDKYNFLNNLSNNKKELKNLSIEEAEKIIWKIDWSGI